MLRLTLAGAVVMPAAPGFYHRPESVEDLVNFIAARALDQFDIPHSLAKRWRGSDGGDPSL
jgi:4-hydroxy-3-polyprenylbenzoate decarboxylase